MSHEIHGRLHGEFRNTTLTSLINLANSRVSNNSAERCFFFKYFDTPLKPQVD